MEEIKSKYYREMKKFVGIPNIFRGVSGEAAAADLIFPAMIDRNASGFYTCYYKASELFKRLDSVQNIFKVRIFVQLLCDLLKSCFVILQDPISFFLTNLSIFVNETVIYYYR